MEFKDYTYLFEETIEDIKKTISNVNEVIKNQDILIEVIKNSNKFELNDLMNQLINTNDNYKLQIEKLNFKIEKIEVLINKMKELNSNKEMVALIIETFGLFNINSSNETEGVND